MCICIHIYVYIPQVIFITLKLRVRVCVCACVRARGQIPADPRYNIKAPKVGVTVNCERPSVGARNRTVVLESCHILLALNQLSSPIIC